MPFAYAPRECRMTPRSIPTCVMPSSTTFCPPSPPWMPTCSPSRRRSDMALLDGFGKFNYPNDIGPGVYDIHSPRVPGIADMVRLLQRAAAVVPPERLWVNPDCGLKTRSWKETEAALRNMVEAARTLRTRST